MGSGSFFGGPYHAWKLGRRWVDKQYLVSGCSGEQDINAFTFQYFVNYNIPDSGGWYLTSAPINSANWEADSGNKWTVPIGGGAGRVFKIGKQPVNAQAQAFYNVEKPEFGADWQLRLQLQFLFPK